MLVRRFTFTVLAFICFLAALDHEGLIFSVSGETVQTVPSQITVKQGVTQDNAFTITQVANAPRVPPNKKSPNHARTLRAFYAPDRGGIETLYIESVLPHSYYAVTGRFSVSREYPALLWIDQETLVFYGTSPDGLIYEITLNVRSLDLETRLTDEAAMPPVMYDMLRDAVM